MVIVSLAFVVYYFFLIALLVGWRRAQDMTTELPASREPLVSVVIPVRNEENTILKLLRSIELQEYRNFEVVIVNDDSEDETLWMASQSHMGNLRIIHSPGNGKKAAITAGVRAARGNIIVATDADCLVSPGWLKGISTAFVDPRVKMVFGGVRMEGENSLFDALQGMEFASLIGSGASTASLGFPTMCNGANLAFRKKVFSEVSGYEGNMHVPSGDDEFLMRKVHRRHPNGVRFLYASDVVVTTEMQPDLLSFVNQRIRWASKWRFNTSGPARITAVIVLMFQAAFIANWFYLFTPEIMQAVFLMALKMILEAAFLLQVCRFLRMRWKWLAFFILQVVYPLYVILVGAASFFRPFEWKHRTFRPH